MSNNNNKFFDSLVSKTKIYLIIIAILLLIICIIKPILILPALIVYVLIIFYTYWTNQKRMAEVSEHIRDLTLNVDNVSKRTLINSPFPLIIVETDGSIIWKSTRFVSEFRDVDINPILDEVIKDLKLEIENNTKLRNNQISQKIVIGNKNYKILGEYVKSKQVDKKKKYMATLYFVDETEIVNLKSDYNNSQICVGIAMIDNYEEILQRTSGEEQVQLFSQIEKKLYDWASEYKCLVIKVERDTFIWICEQKYLEKIEESKFNILDIIKEINVSNKIQSTLSMAVSTEGDSNYEKYQSAKNAIDIALGRGGDQVVIRKNGKYTFFGGRTQELEKRTRVKARSVASALEELIQESENVVVMGHTNSDIDALGSALGIYRLAKSLGKDARVLVETRSTGIEKFIEEAKKDPEYSDCFIGKTEANEMITANTLLVVSDTNKKNYVEDPELLEKIKRVVVIDHHRRSTEYIEDALLTFHEVYASSASELVTEILEYSQMDINLREIEIEALYAGIMLDTKDFTFKTGVRTFEAAAYLRKCGVDIIKVKKWFQNDLETYQIISEIIAKSEIMNDNIAISIYDTDNPNANIIAAKAADELLTIGGITASFVLGRVGDKIYISGRSVGEINVQIILEKLGGGGHITLAGARIN